MSTLREMYEEERAVRSVPASLREVARRTGKTVGEVASRLGFNNVPAPAVAARRTVNHGGLTCVACGPLRLIKEVTQLRLGAVEVTICAACASDLVEALK